MDDCIFCKIIKGEIPSAKIYEDDDVYAFLDIGPVNKGHSLVIPKCHCETVMECDDEVLQKVIVVVKKIPRAPRGRLVQKRSISFIVQEDMENIDRNSPFVEYLSTLVINGHEAV